jgi:hypothetical protein
LLLFILLAAYLGTNYFLKNMATRVVEELKPRLEEKGVIIASFDYENVRLTSYNAITITGIDLDFYLNRAMYGKEAFRAEFDARSIRIRFANFSDPSFFFTLNDFSVFIQPTDQNAHKPFGRLENAHLKSRIPVYLESPEASARKIIEAVKSLFKTNSTVLDLDLRATVRLGMDDKEVEAGLFTERSGDSTSLKFNHMDILNAAQQFELDLTEKEAEIIAKYPNKVPAMIKITRDAKRYSELEKNKNASFPEDAYRHIYWSYHLTRALGADLARQITDAHETAPGNTKHERLMDYHNNEIGRRLGQNNLIKDDLKRLVMESDEIVKNPSEMAGR